MFGLLVLSLRFLSNACARACVDRLKQRVTKPLNVRKTGQSGSFDQNAIQFSKLIPATVSLQVSACKLIMHVLYPA